MSTSDEMQQPGSREEEMGSGLALAVLERPAGSLTPAQAELRRRVLAAVRSPRTRRSYGEALDDLFRFLAGRPLSRSLLQEWKAGMSHRRLDHQRPARCGAEDDF